MTQSYSGSSILEICKGLDPWKFYIPPISASKHHSVLFQLPVDFSNIPQPYIPHSRKHWDDDYVRMPFSPHNLYPVKEGDKEILKSRWDLICNALKEPIKTCQELESAIQKYNNMISNFPALEYFFEEELNEEESTHFFENLLPKIINLALSLPEILPGNLPLLKKGHNKSISLSQFQVSSLLANAFLCTFPWKKEVATLCPGVNFARLFASSQRESRVNCVAEKLKCIVHYFRRITLIDPKGVITFERIFFPRNKLPRWDTSDNNLGNTRIHIQSDGTIEDDGFGFLQVDFANKNVGGGVLGYGCVQEEIRFVICPELLISRLFVEQLGDTESVIVRGVERFSGYTGYGETFQWNGDFIDETPLDGYGRRQTAISIIDATLFHRVDHQYNPSAILRELNKAYVGFYSHHTDNLAPVATGNWGCGAFRGDPKLKTLIQLIACNATHRDLVYYTFGNKETEETFYNMYLFIATNRILTRQLWRIFCRFAAAKLPADQFYSFIQQSYFDAKSKPENPIEDAFKKAHSKTVKTLTQKSKFFFKKKEDNVATPSSSRDEVKTTKEENAPTQNNSSQSNASSEEDVIPSSQPESQYTIPVKKAKEKTKFDEKFFEETHMDIVEIFSEIDGPPISKKNNEDEANDTLLSEVAKLEKSKEKKEKPDEVIVFVEDDNSMDVDASSEIAAAAVVKQKSRITDYFLKLSKS